MLGCLDEGCLHAGFSGHGGPTPNLQLKVPHCFNGDIRTRNLVSNHSLISHAPCSPAAQMKLDEIHIRISERALGIEPGPCSDLHQPASLRSGLC